ncbi:MAG: hypothetical protein F6K11_02975 [Leptolyngbya sp. SIO3F4]|nr:hypothetical protein [Leptolyngbya sp. SIO3F4]
MRWTLPPRNLRFVIVGLLVLGIFFRFANLDQKLYWRDEAFTSLRIFGYTKQEVTNEVTDGKIVGKVFLQSYQKFNPQKGLFDVVKSLAVEDPKHPPLYFVMTRLWTQVFGDSVAVIRSFSAFISLLILPSIYWLCLELFGASSLAWMAVALIAVSPFHIIYAQEARMYALHMLNILLSSAALLRAIRLNTKRSWGLYAGTISLGLYTHTIFSLVAVIHGVYVILNKGFRASRIFISYLKSSLLGLLFFAPWLFLILSQLDKVQSTTDWVYKINLSLDDLRIGWEVHFARLFFDINPSYEYKNDVYDNLWWVVIRVLIVLFVYSLYFLIRRSSKKIYSFILVLIFLPALVLAVPDVLFGGIRSIQARYSIITYLGCQLSLIYLFAKTNRIDYFDGERKWQYLWGVLFVILISLEIVSCSLSFSQDTWWNKGINSHNLPMSNILNQESSLLMSECSLSSLQNWDEQFGNLISLSYHLNNQVKMQCFDNFEQIDISKIPDGFNRYFLLNPPASLQTQIEQQHQLELEPVYENYESLWKLER